MKRTSIILTALAVILYLGALPAFAQRGRGGMGGGPPMGRGPGMESHPAPMGPSPAGVSHGNPRADMGRVSASSPRQPVDMLSQHPQLATRLQSQLPAGTNLQGAASGFKNLGQFVAAVHVSRNLDIPFAQLKARMTGPNAVSLGKAIKELKPGVDSKAAAKRAEK